MLTKVDIRNYRGFPSYRMENLARVNLLVGKNNSGKTALLEGVQLLVSAGDPVALLDAAQRRGEQVFTGRSERIPGVDIRHFFHGHELAPEAHFALEGDNGYRPVNVRIVPERKKEEPDIGPGVASRYAGVLLKIEGGRGAKRSERVFRITRDGAVDLELESRRRFGVSEPSLFQNPDQAPVRFLSPDSLNTGQLAPLLDEIQINQLEGEIVAALAILEDDVESVSMLSGMSPYAYYASRAGVRVGLRGVKQRIPLGSMGDGMRRILALSASVACAKEGALFADEVDTGLHYSIMPDVWRLVIDRAMRFNVQVFATTHSWDCIAALSLLCQDDLSVRSQVAIHKVDRSLDHSIAFSGDSVARMERHHIDPR